jgi:hypothetical protein
MRSFSLTALKLSFADCDYRLTGRSFVALNHIAAAIIAFRKVKLTANITYG